MNRDKVFVVSKGKKYYIFSFSYEKQMRYMLDYFNIKYQVYNSYSNVPKEIKDKQVAYKRDFKIYQFELSEIDRYGVFYFRGLLIKDLLDFYKIKYDYSIM